MQPCHGPGWLVFPRRKPRTIWSKAAQLHYLGYRFEHEQGADGLHLEYERGLDHRSAYLTPDDVRGLIAALTKWLESL